MTVAPVYMAAVLIRQQFCDPGYEDLKTHNKNKTPSQYGWTAMHCAAMNGNTAIVALLDKAHPELYQVKDKVRRPRGTSDFIFLVRHKRVALLLHSPCLPAALIGDLVFLFVVWSPTGVVCNIL